MNIVDKFREIRDIPYRIPLFLDEPDDCCSGKAIRLFYFLKDAGYEARYLICTFLWSKVGLPKEVEGVSHEDKATHMFLEVKIGTEWKTVDPTWDSALSGIFEISNWDGKSDTKVAVPVIKLLSPEESLKYIEKTSTKEELLKDLKRNGDFYKAFNNWLEKVRAEAKH